MERPVVPHDKTLKILPLRCASVRMTKSQLGLFMSAMMTDLIFPYTELIG